MELTRASQGTVSMQQKQPSKKSKIVMLLTVLGVRRQAKLDKEDYLIFAADLEKYELDDIEAALESLRRRLEHQTAFPDVDTIERAIRDVIHLRKPRTDDSGTKWLAYMEAYKAEVNSDAPDEELAAKISALNEKMGVTR